MRIGPVFSTTRPPLVLWARLPVIVNVTAAPAWSPPPPHKTRGPPAPRWFSFIVTSLHMFPHAHMTRGVGGVCLLRPCYAAVAARRARLDFARWRARDPAVAGVGGVMAVPLPRCSHWVQSVVGEPPQRLWVRVRGGHLVQILRVRTLLSEVGHPRKFVWGGGHSLPLNKPMGQKWDRGVGFMKHSHAFRLLDDVLTWRLAGVQPSPHQRMR